MRIPTVVVVGSAARDIAPDDPRGWRLGGGVTYGSLALGRLGLAVGALIGVDDAAATASELDLLKEAGVDVRLVRLEHGPVFENIEGPDGRIQMAISPSDQIDPRSLPGEWLGARGWFFGPVADELGAGWAEVVPADAIVATGWQGLLREVVGGEQVRRLSPRPTALVARTDLMGVSRDDLDPDHALDDLCRLLRPGATLVLTQGARGGISMTAGSRGATEMRLWPGIAPDEIVDPTGAGDVFLAALFATHVEPRLLGGSVDRHLDLRVAAAAASLVLERPGLLGVPYHDAVRRRIARGSGSA